MLPKRQPYRALIAALTLVTAGALARATATDEASAGPAPDQAPAGRFPKVLLPVGFPAPLAREAQRIADVINGGDDAAIARIDTTGGGLKQFWSSYAPIGTIVFRAFVRERGGFVLHDAGDGMFSCDVELRGGAWKVTECVFNDGY